MKTILKSFFVLSLGLGVPFMAHASAGTHQLEFVATYLQPGTTHPDQNYLPEFIDHLSAVHLGPEYFGQVHGLLKTQQAIIDLADEFFDYDQNMGALLPNHEANWEALVQKHLAGREDKIRAFYIADEPSDYGITRESLETVIHLVKTKYPNIPTYIIWDQDCFDNTPALDKKCDCVGHRGIPDNVDWVGFDWYLRNDHEKDEADFNANIVPALERMEKLTSKSIVLVPDGTDQFLKKYTERKRDDILVSRLNLFYDLATHHPQVIGLDNYAWSNHQEVLRGVDTYVVGTRDYPKTKQRLFEIAKETN